MNEETVAFERPPSDGILPLSDGGFTGDTEVMTTDGPRPISDLASGEQLYAIDPTTRLTKPKELVEVQRCNYEASLISIQSRRSDLRVHPKQRIPYTTKQIDTVRIQRAGNLSEKREYRLLNEWKTTHSQGLRQVDITDYVSEYEMCAATDCHGHSFRAALPDGCEPCRRNSHIGYFFDPATFKRFQADIESIAADVTIHGGPNHRRGPYKFDGDDFIQLLAWYITEGNVSWKETSDSAQVKIAQESKEYRRSIASLFTRLGIETCETDRHFQFGSVIFGELLERFCGSGSKNKHLPEFIWSLSQAQKQLILEVLLWGDGNDRGTYYTASERLAGDVLRLCTELGIKPAYRTRRGVWQVYVRSVNDGLDSTRNVGLADSPGDLYQLTLRDYSFVLAGRNGRFQWIGVGGVT
jgi:DNA polymerase I